MPLIIEDGTIVTNANSYVTLVELQAYADDRGFTLPTSDAEQEQFVLRAMDYLESRRFQGKRADETQSLQWPRTGVKVNCIDFAEDEIPETLKKALSQLVVELQAGTPLYPSPRTSSSEGFVTQKTVGPLTKKFSSFGAISTVSPITIAAVELFLKPLECCNSDLRTVRV